MQVVVAEDSAPTRRMMETVLARAGHEVTAVADGDAALAAFERVDPAMVVLDWMMPGLDGLAVCRGIRGSAGGDRVFILMVTSRDGDASLATALAAGVDDYVMKPVTADHLGARVAIAARRLELDAARRAAEEALARAQWLAGIGETALAVRHDVNNPLAAALAELQLAGQLPVAPPVKDHLAAATTQVRRIADVVRRLGAIDDPRTVEYLPGVRMLDLSRPR